jgi:hypothetical protein
MILYLAQMFNEPKGKTSCQRTCLFLVLVCVLVWSTMIVQAKQVIPELPTSWVWLIGILLGGIGFSKGVDAFTTVKGGGNV